MNELSDIGRLAWDPIWKPVLAWTAFALVGALLLRLFGRHQLLIQLEARLALLAALPVAIVAAPFLPALPINDTSAAAVIEVVALLDLEVAAPSPSLPNAPPLVETWSIEGTIGILTLLAAVLAIVGIGKLIIGAISLRSLIRQSGPDSPLPGGSRIQVRYSTQITGPLSCGLLRPRILLPVGFPDSEVAILHETMHHRSGDILRAWVVAIVRGIFFFHPLVHFLGRRTQQLCELICDHRVLSDRSVDRQRYATALLRAANSRVRFPGAIAMARRGLTLRSRLDRMHSGMESFMDGPSVSIAAVFTLVLVGFTAGCGGPGKSDHGAAASPILLSRMELPASSESHLPANLDEVPEIHGGVSALAALLDHPSEKCQERLQGTVLVEFDLDPKGYASNFDVLRGLSGDCDNEAIRILESVRFAPAVRDGKRVWTRTSLPIRFRTALTRRPWPYLEGYSEDLRYRFQPQKSDRPIDLYELPSDITRAWTVMATGGAEMNDRSPETLRGLARAVGGQAVITGAGGTPPDLGMFDNRLVPGDVAIIVYLDGGHEEHLIVEATAGGAPLTILGLTVSTTRESVRYTLPVDAGVRVVDVLDGTVVNVDGSDLAIGSTTSIEGESLILAVHKEGESIRRVQSATRVIVRRMGPQ